MKIYKEIMEYNVLDTWITVVGNRIVHVGIHNDCMCLWYTICEDNPEIKFQYKVVGTGWEFDGDCIVVGSVIDPPFVWHVLERQLPD